MLRGWSLTANYVDVVRCVQIGKKAVPFGEPVQSVFNIAKMKKSACSWRLLHDYGDAGVCDNFNNNVACFYFEMDAAKS